MSSGSDKVPGIRKNPAPLEEEDFMKLTDDEQKEKLNNELQMWNVAGMAVANVPHNIFNMDAMVISLVRVLTRELGVDEAVMNRYYRWVVYGKLTEIRREHQKTQIIHATQMPKPVGDIEV